MFGISLTVSFLADLTGGILLIMDMTPISGDPLNLYFWFTLRNRPI
jgi:hypothetical protein